MRIAGHALATSQRAVPEGLALFAIAGVGVGKVIPQRDVGSGPAYRQHRSSAGKTGFGCGFNVPGVSVAPFMRGMNNADEACPRAALDIRRAGMESAAKGRAPLAAHAPQLSHAQGFTMSAGSVRSLDDQDVRFKATGAHR